MDKNKIVGDIVVDSLNPDARPIGDVAGRWISPDPLSEEFPEWSPYNFCFDNPLKFVDPDGRAAIDPNEYDFDITTGKTTLVSNKGGNTTDYVNYTRGEGENKETIWTETIPVVNTITNVQTNGEMTFGPFFERSPGISNATFFNGRSGALYDPSADIFISWAGGKIAGQLLGAAWKGISGLFTTESATVATEGTTMMGETFASTPVGRLGSPMNVAKGTNSPAVINGQSYSGHALDQMQGRGLTPSVVQDVINNPVRTTLGNTPGTTVSYGNGVKVVTSASKKVITVMPKTH